MADVRNGQAWMLEGCVFPPGTLQAEQNYLTTRGAEKNASRAKLKPSPLSGGPSKEGTEHHNRQKHSMKVPAENSCATR